MDYRTHGLPYPVLYRTFSLANVSTSSPFSLPLPPPPIVEHPDRAEAHESRLPAEMYDDSDAERTEPECG